MADWQIIADGKQYKVPEKLTLGEQMILASDFGIDNMSEFELSNIRHISGLLFVAMCRETPNVARSNLRAALNVITSLDFVDLDVDEDTEPTEPDPTRPVVADGGNVDPGA